MHNTSMTKISEYDYEQLLVCLIGDVAKSILDCSDIDLKIELFRKYLITINNIIDFTKEYNRLPAFDSSKIEFLLK